MILLPTSTIIPTATISPTATIISNIGSTYFGIENKDLFTLIVSIINIITTISLTLVNLYTTYKSTKRVQKRAIYSQYYIPLSEIINLLMLKITGSGINIEAFDIYDNKKDDRSFKISIIEDYYKKYISFIESNKYMYYCKEIDDMINVITMHMQIVVMTYKIDRIYQMDEIRKKYPMPDYAAFLDRVRKSKY